MIGKSISHYRILEKLGEGGMGVMYKAIDTRLDRPVALKFLPHESGARDTDRERFIQEAKAASSLDHPNIGTIYDIGRADDGQTFIAMAYYAGETLQKKISRAPLPVDLAANIALQICEGLSRVHDVGITHRDIKPANIIITDQGVAKIVDFGLAKLSGGARLTRTGTTAGTVAYMSPEQIRSEDVDCRSDIFSFGVVLYEMITGRLPFRGDHEAAMMYSIVNEEPIAHEVDRADIPDELLHVVERALKKNPDERYQTIAEMKADVLKLSIGAPTSALTGGLQAANAIMKLRGIWQTVVKRKKTLAIGGVVVAVLLIAIPVLFILSTSEVDSGERVMIAVVDIQNRTNEEDLDGLSGMLITSLEQSRRLSVMTRSRMLDVLRILGKENTGRIDESLGREICRVAEVNALALASIRKFDQLYTIDLKILDPKDDEYIFATNEEGEGKASIPGMIDRLSERTRIGLKEHRQMVRSSSQKISVMTTGNLEAYRHFFRGEQLLNNLKFDSAAEEFRAAIAIDSTFALAYFKLSYVLGWDNKPAGEAIEKARRYGESLPEKDRLYIDGQYAINEKNLPKAIEIYKRIVRDYPDEKEALYRIGDYSFHSLDFSTSRDYLQRVLALDPEFERAYQHLIFVHTESEVGNAKLKVARDYVAKVPNEQSYFMLANAHLNVAQFDSAFHVYRLMMDRFPSSPMPIMAKGQTYMLLHRFDEAESEFRKLLGESRPFHDRFSAYRNLAWLNVYKGKYREVSRTFEKLIDIGHTSANDAQRGLALAEHALWSLFVLNDSTSARGRIAAVRKLGVEGGDIAERLILIYALLGDLDEALRIGDAYFAVASPYYQRFVGALQNIKDGNNAEAQRQFSSLPATSMLVGEVPLYLKARFFQAVNQPDSSIRQLQSLLGIYSLWYQVYHAMVYPKSLYLLGTVFESQGNKKAAIEQYQKLLMLWKEADSDIPELIDTKSRMARLKTNHSK